MHARQIFLFVTLFISAPCFSQDKVNADITDVAKVTILSPGIGYEKRIGKYQSLYLQGFLSISGGFGYSSSLGFISELYLDPALSLEYRYYYNFVQRQERGKRTALNSLNYLSPFFRTVFAKRNVPTTPGDFERRRRAIHTLGATWGLQRNYKSRLSLDLNIGFGYIFKEAPYTDNSGLVVTDHNGQFTFPGRLSLGIWFNKR